VRYTGNGGIRPMYECKGRWEHGKKATCSHISAVIVDAAVSEKILSLMKPSEFEIALKLIRNATQTAGASDHGWKLALERAEYEASRAERQYMLAEPENRLVVRTLETAWNQKLEELDRLKKDYAAHASKKVWQPSDNEYGEIASLSESIPQIWNAQSSSYKDKKRIVRILMEDITVIAESGNPKFTLGLRYRSGRTETLTLSKPRKRSDEVRHTDETINTVRNLSTSMNDAQIADHLNKCGFRTGVGKDFTEDSVQWIRYKHKIPSFMQNNRKGLSVKEAAELLGISTGKVYYHISNGIIPAVKQFPGWPWEISLDEEKIADLKNLLGQ